jgi:PAS domain S-box-containing protein
VEVEQGLPGLIYILRNVTDRVEVTLDLQRQKQYYQALFKNIPVAIATLKLDRTIVDCNPAFESLFGYTLDEVKGKPLDPLITPPESLGLSQALTESAAQGELVREVTQRMRKDGALVQVEAFGIPVTLWGKRIAVLGLYHDISGLDTVQRSPTGPLAALAVGTEHAGLLAPQEPELELEAELPETEILAAETLPAEWEAEAPLGEQAELETAAEPEAAPADMQEPALEAAEEEAEGAETQAAPVEPAALEAEAEPAEPTEHPEAPMAAPPAAPPAPARTIPSAPAYQITRIEGIGPAYSRRLADIGILTTKDLLKAGSTRKGRTQIAEQTGISQTLVLEWVNRADLMRVPGVGEEFSDLLEAAGVDTVKELRNRNPENLLKAMQQVNEAKHLVRRTPSLAEVTGWVEMAKMMEVFVSY